MTEMYTIEVTRQPVDGDDTAGHAVVMDSKQLSGEISRLAPGATLRLTLPVAEAQADDDVQGHIWPIFAIIAGGFLAGYGGVSVYRNHIEGVEVPRNRPGANNP